MANWHWDNPQIAVEKDAHGKLPERGIKWMPLERINDAKQNKWKNGRALDLDMLRIGDVWEEAHLVKTMNNGELELPLAAAPAGIDPTLPFGEKPGVPSR